MSRDLPTQYNPKEVEDKIYRVWLRSGFFNPDRLPKHKTQDAKHKTYCITVPPPNITGELHMGHALNATIQDILIRKKRMEGYKTLWLPGTDHAGIATQNAVEKELKKQGLTRHDLGREKFLEKVLGWKEKYGHIILDQFKKLGSSMDWSRTRFTMDPEYREAVKEAFLHYHKKGLIYRAERVINWCPRCATSLSDLELEYKEIQGVLYYINYPRPDGGGAIMVATTRPETMLGDTAVAVNPKDKRYKELVGKEVMLPIQNRRIPIIADRAVDESFGTGAVKVTPAHDLLDAEIGERHKLAVCKIIGPDGRMTKEAGPICEGLKAGECREKIIEELKRLKLLEREESYIHNVASCYRCGAAIEPIPSMQWFLKMDTLAKAAIRVIKSGKTRFYPRRWEKIYFAWLKNVKDWTISRQIWWGHRLPVWYCIKKMGFAGDVVPQLFSNKTRTYRLRDHGFQIGDRIAFENSATGDIFGYGIITEIKKTAMGEIDLKDQKHHKTYNTREELIAAFKRHPQKVKEITENTPAWIYTYRFYPLKKPRSAFVVSIARPKSCPVCNSCGMQQSEDVLDTWFSSALWPFATLGWPKKTKDFKTFYPTNVLSTARDIINLWVARMVFSGLEFMGREPFRDVIIHATILTKEGKRMSKSLGTGIDPMDLISQYGADAARFGLIWQHMGNQDIHWSEEHVVAGRKFCNKVWNSARFVLLQIPNSKFQVPNKSQVPNPKSQTKADKKILAAIEKIKKEVNRRVEKYEFGQALHTLYDFFWHEFCDVYIEKAKSQISNAKCQMSTRFILLYVLAESIKLLHPFMPFITEEVWNKLPIKNKRLLLVALWPK